MSDLTPEPQPEPETEPEAEPERASESVPADPASAPAPAAPRSVRQSLAMIVLGFEVIVVFLAVLVIWGLSRGADGSGGLPSWAVLAAGGVIIVGLIATIGLLRFRWAYVLGWVLQVLIVAAGFLNPAMFVVGVLFGGMWAYCMVAGSRIDRQRAAAAAPGKEQQ
jgi:hypothetical protein